MDINALLEDEVDVLHLLSSSSEDESGTCPGGSRPGRAPNIERFRERGAIQLHRDYFAANSVYSSQAFRRRFRVSRSLYNRVRATLLVFDGFFHTKKDAAGKKGLSTDQKLTAALRMLAYGSSADSIDEYVRIAESTTLQCLSHFCNAVVAAFAAEYLRSPTEDDLKHILGRNAARGCPGLLGSIDCCKWRWRNCPTGWQGQFVGKEGVPTITLEAIADERMWIWHLFFGMPGSANDINVLDNSTLLDKIASGTYPMPVKYKIAGVDRNKPYWFGDGIYPRYPCFILPESHPTNAKEALFSRTQESIRKDVERAFGRLQNKWHILGRSSRFWSKAYMQKVVQCCVILHNMTIDMDMPRPDQGSTLPTRASTPPIETGGAINHMWREEGDDASAHIAPGSIAAMCRTKQFTADIEAHLETKRLLVDHLWNLHGSC